jgi:hypothetical protein
MYKSKNVDSIPFKRCFSEKKLTSVNKRHPIERRGNK